ncbi:hypothetical protein IMG5_047430 [Ichthyophthirius multifiliis]|uniref:Cullin family profile domain-containing protein n=1 Tax=Ichthyophthirius multifiliis TaxID=5932 RepID=G0QMB2_ICHMU|nr:hypothetical protein IMG5_047430 [Ichthyophthirius multifiliis]EGR33634.1 hypothetical protein IMG5_047430 [Ichthyophthirius multifiliis]|eukprot:XP_004037620.1 hypothetical protein IMG5_047430 [Ichthyophthirius multifiliis]
MNDTFKKNVNLYEEAVSQIQNINQKVLKLLKNDQTVVISNAEFMPCYNAVLQACDCSQDPSNINQSQIQNNEELLFNYYIQLIKNYLNTNLIECQSINDQEVYVDTVHYQYKNFQIYLHWLHKLFYYLDNFYLKNKNTNLHSEGFKNYREDYFNIINKKLFKTIVHFQIFLREDQTIPREKVKKLIKIYNEVGFKKTAKLTRIANTYDYVFEIDDSKKYYEENFQNPFADEMEIYYQKKINEWAVLSTPEYVQEALNSFQKEEDIASQYYHNSSRIIINRIEQIVIQQQSEQLVNNEQTGLAVMFKEKKEQEMQNLYKLFQRVKETLEHIAKKITIYIQFHGQSYNDLTEQRKNENQTQKDIAIEYIEKVFQLKKECDHLIQDIFSNNILLQKARDSAFQYFLNKCDKSTFFLATHADVILKTENLQNDQEIEEKLSQIAKIFVYFYSRDTFFKHYQKFFSNRLLNSTSRNKEAEKQLISKFKTEAGQAGVNKIETMLKDINNSEEFHQEIKKQLSQYQVELFANVLTTGSWPLQKIQDNCEIPEQLQDMVNKFKQIYKDKYKGRNINWLFSQGTAEISFKTQKEKYILIVSTYQMIALQKLQAQGNSVTFQKLLQVSGIENSELQNAIIPFVKLKILNCQGIKNDVFEENNEIEINVNFAFKQKRIRCIPGGKQGQIKKQKEEEMGKQQFQEEVSKEREYILDACIVRVMKSRKIMKHNELIPEVIKLVNNFKPEIPVIKRRIESLIERDYIKRDQYDKNSFHYVP